MGIIVSLRQHRLGTVALALAVTMGCAPDGSPDKPGNSQAEVVSTAPPYVRKSPPPPPPPDPPYTPPAYDPRLPRYLYIGDSISANYTAGLLEALRGKANGIHSPGNSEASSKGRAEIISWLGPFYLHRARWDVISFNFGHWDAWASHATKAEYQENLEFVIEQLQKTQAALIWVTTTPVPLGYPPPAPLGPDGRLPGRRVGVIESYVNPWAMEVIHRHPEIDVCDPWQFIKDHEADLFRDWWRGDNVHLYGEGAAAVGRLLAEHVVSALDARASKHVRRSGRDRGDKDPQRRRRRRSAAPDESLQ